jgi:hypothetical protein
MSEGRTPYRKFMRRRLGEFITGRRLMLPMLHNIDLDPRIEGLAEGDRVAFNGEYESNDEGGMIHWTHHDPGAQHRAGWLKHQGQVYQ